MLFEVTIPAAGRAFSPTSRRWSRPAKWYCLRKVRVWLQCDGWIPTHRTACLFPNRPMLHRTVAKSSFESGC